jgi:hypothetical protein
VNERFRWENETAPNTDLFKGLLIYVCRSSVAEAAPVEERYKDVKEIASVARQRTGIVIERYSVYGVQGPVAEPLDQRTLHDVLKQQRLALESPALVQPQMPPVAKKSVQSCESEADHAAVHSSDGQGWARMSSQ